MATPKEFAVRRRVRYGHIPAIELKSTLEQMPVDGAVRITAHIWKRTATGDEILMPDGCRLPFSIELSADKRELTINIFADVEDDKDFRQKVRDRQWGLDPDSIEAITAAELARLDEQDAAAARNSAIADFMKDREKQERAEKRMNKVNGNC